METRFSHLYQRDSSVSMLRVKMARRRSQSQKENRDRTVNRLRRLDQLPELEASVMDQSVMAPAVASEGTAPVQKPEKSHNAAVEERKKMLARYKEAKELQKEKERREKEKKGGVFKVGLYKPQPLSTLPQISTAPSRAKISAPAPSSRVTRSMKQQQVQKPVTQRETASALKKVEATAARAPRSRAVSKPQTSTATNRGRVIPVEPSVRAATTRAASRPQAAAHKPASVDASSGPKTRATNKQPAQGKNETKAQTKTQKPAVVDEMETTSADPHPEAEEPKTEEQTMETEEQTEKAEEAPALPSFAPQGFVFQAPSGLKSFQPVPLTPRSADAFLTPSYSSIPPAVVFSPVAPQRCVEPPHPSPPAPPPPPPPQALPPPLAPQEPQHDVPYFRSVLVSETDRLKGLCEQWDVRTEDLSIPEECRDRMRTAVGQARLLMKERFGQFEGLVDDCDLGRGEKITTCTDLQGFWDMVYFQVDDVIRKFDALKEAESRGWQEEHKPPPRPKKTVKKVPSAAAAGKTGAGGGANAAAKSRLAAVKAAMKAKRAAEADRATQGPAGAATDPEGPPQSDTTAAQTVVFHGGFFRVESPVKAPGSIRRSSRMSAAPSPCPTSKFTTPARLRRSNASAQPSPLPQLSLTPLAQSNATPARTPRPVSRALLPQDHSGPPQPTHPAEHEAMGSLRPSGQDDQDVSDQTEYETRQSAGPDPQEELATEHLDGPLAQPGAHSQAAVAVSQSQVEVMPLQTLTDQEETTGQAKFVTETTESLANLPGDVSEPVTDSPVPVVSGTLSPSRQAQTEDTQEQSICLSPSPCPKAGSLPTEGHGLSFTLSPCLSHLPQTQGEQCGPSDPSLFATHLLQASPLATPLTPQGPMISCTSTVCSIDSPTVSADVHMGGTPDTSYTENVPGLDFERYLQPTLRCSLSPQAPVGMEAASLLATPTSVDVPMDSPGPQLEQLPEGGALTHTAPALTQPAALGHMLTQHTERPADSELLLFTPEPRDRVQQSVCERDLMMFTPPSSR